MFVASERKSAPPMTSCSGPRRARLLSCRRARSWRSDPIEFRPSRLAFRPDRNNHATVIHPSASPPPLSSSAGLSRAQPRRAAGGRSLAAVAWAVGSWRALDGELFGRSARFRLLSRNRLPSLAFAVLIGRRQLPALARTRSRHALMH